jgi:hypothetical protein
MRKWIAKFMDVFTYVYMTIIAVVLIALMVCGVLYIGEHL